MFAGQMSEGACALAIETALLCISTVHHEQGFGSGYFRKSFILILYQRSKCAFEHILLFQGDLFLSCLRPLIVFWFEVQVVLVAVEDLELPVLEMEYFVSLLKEVGAMGNHNSSSSFQLPANAVIHQRPSNGRVDCRERVVEEIEISLSVDGSSQRDTRALPSAESGTLFSHKRC